MKAAFVRLGGGVELKEVPVNLFPLVHPLPRGQVKHAVTDIGELDGQQGGSEQEAKKEN